MLKTYHYGSLRKYVDLLKKIGVMAAGLGISGAIGAISAILLLHLDLYMRCIDTQKCHRLPFYIEQLSQFSSSSNGI